MRRRLPLSLVLLALLCGCPVPAPGPGPGPTPDGDAPFPAEGLHVLIIHETKDAAQLPAGQRAILWGQATREFLDGKTAGWRIYDPQQDVTNDAEVWKAGMDVPRESLPWLLVSNGRAGYSGPLPETPEAFREIVNQHAGT